MNSLLKAVFFASVTASSMLAHAVAPVTSTYTDEATFISKLNVGSASTGYFATAEALDGNGDVVPAPDVSLTGITSAGVNFSSNGVTFGINPNSFYLLDRSANSAYALPLGFGILSVQNGGGGSQNILTATASSGITAIGFWYGNQSSSDSTLSITLNNNSLLLPPTVSSFNSQSTSNFIGFISSDSITSVTFSQSSSGPIVFDVTKVIVGVAAPVPEPSSTLMFGVGLAFLGAIGRRKMRKQ